MKAHTRHLIAKRAVAGGFMMICSSLSARGQATKEPIIDVHVHAFAARALGRTVPIPTCAGALTFSPRDSGEAYSFGQFARCEKPLMSALTDEELEQRTLEFDFAPHYFRSQRNESNRQHFWETDLNGSTETVTPTETAGAAFFVA